MGGIKHLICIDSKLDEMDDESINSVLGNMSKDEANECLFEDYYKKRWCRIHNSTANLYFVRNGMIKDIDPSGWYY